MSYTPHIWIKGDRITKQRLNTIENGISTLDTNFSNFIENTYSSDVVIPKVWQMQPGFFICSANNISTSSVPLGYLGYAYQNEEYEDSYLLRSGSFEQQVFLGNTSLQAGESTIMFPIFIMPPDVTVGEFKLAWYINEAYFDDFNITFQPIIGSYPSLVDTDENGDPKVYQFHTHGVSDYRKGFILNGSCYCTVSQK